MFSEGPTFTSTINAAALVLSSTLTVGGNTTGDSNLGTISSVTLSSNYVGSFTATWTGSASNFASNQTITVTYQKIGRMVTLNIPTKTATAGAGTITDLVSDAMPSALRPLTTIDIPAYVMDNGAFLNAPGVMEITTGGLIDFNKTALGAGFTAGTTVGWKSITITYISAT